MKLHAVVALLVIASGAVFAQGGDQEWPIVIENPPSNPASCATGVGNSLIRVKDGSLSLVFTSFPQPIWTVKPAADGSFDAVVPSFADKEGARITIPAGTGPRVITTLTQSQPCGHRLVPK